MFRTTFESEKKTGQVRLSGYLGVVSDLCDEIDRLKGAVGPVDLDGEEGGLSNVLLFFFR